MIYLTFKYAIIPILISFLVYRYLNIQQLLFPVDNKSHNDVQLGSGEMFDKIAPYYDTINRIISLGMDTTWRYNLVKYMNITEDDRILDIASGTGDVPIDIMKSLKDPPKYPIQIIDPSFKMFLQAKDKILKLGYEKSIQFTLGDATDMSTYETNRFSKVSISFGIRNIKDRNKALSEINRIMNKSTISKFVVLEVFQPRSGILAPIASTFIHYIVPFMGSLFSKGHMKEYNHLRESIAKFPSPEQFMNMLSDAGFQDCKVHDQMLKIIHIFVCDVNTNA